MNKFENRLIGVAQDNIAGIKNEDACKKNVQRIENLARHRDLLINEAHALEAQIIDSNGLTAKQLLALSKQLSETITAMNQINNMHGMYKAKNDIIEPVRTPIIQMP